MSSSDILYLAQQSAGSGYRIASVVAAPIYIAFTVLKRRPLTFNSLLRTTWVGGLSGGLVAGGATYARYGFTDELHAKQARLGVEYDSSRVLESDRALVGGVLGSLVFPAILWNRARIFNVVLGGAGLGAGSGLLFHHYTRLFNQSTGPIQTSGSKT